MRNKKDRQVFAPPFGLVSVKNLISQMYEKKSINGVRFQKKRTLENLFDYAINNDSTCRLHFRSKC